MTHTKRIVTLALALVFCLTLAAPVLAADGEFIISDGILRGYRGGPGGWYPHGPEAQIPCS